MNNISFRYRGYENNIRNSLSGYDHYYLIENHSISLFNDNATWMQFSSVHQTSITCSLGDNLSNDGRDLFQMLLNIYGVQKVEFVENSITIGTNNHLLPNFYYLDNIKNKIFNIDTISISIKRLKEYYEISDKKIFTDWSLTNHDRVFNFCKLIRTKYFLNMDIYCNDIVSWTFEEWKSRELYENNLTRFGKNQVKLFYNIIRNNIPLFENYTPHIYILPYAIKIGFDEDLTTDTVDSLFNIISNELDSHNFILLDYN